MPEFALVSQHKTEAIVGVGVVILDPDGAAELPLRLLQPALAGQQDAEVVVGFGVVILDPDGAAVLFLRPLPLAL